MAGNLYSTPPWAREASCSTTYPSWRASRYHLMANVCNLTFRYGTHLPVAVRRLRVHAHVIAPMVPERGSADARSQATARPIPMFVAPACAHPMPGESVRTCSPVMSCSEKWLRRECLFTHTIPSCFIPAEPPLQPVVQILACDLNSKRCCNDSVRVVRVPA